jgi:solute carrier family 25 iron transporter 28/37
MSNFEEDFEELKPGERVLTHLIAGAIAGTAEHCGMFPIDTIKVGDVLLFNNFINILRIKTNMQAANPGGIQLGVFGTTKTIIKSHGIRGLFRGFSAVASGAGFEIYLTMVK